MKDLIEFVNPKDMPPTNGYSHVVTVQPGETIYLSGQVPLDCAGKYCRDR
jgi:enamine deaminase RidA (YjgF/YER057c/UK114 family)